jgi:thymidine phosphorylase
VATGNAVEAKDVLNDLLSARAFESLDARKTELAQSLFTGKEESVEVQDSEA